MKYVNVYNEVITGIDICNYTFCNHYIIIIRTMCACAYHIPTPYAWGYHHARVSYHGYDFERCRRVFFYRDACWSQIIIIYNIRLLNTYCIVVHPINYNLFLLYRVMGNILRCMCLFVCLFLINFFLIPAQPIHNILCIIRVQITRVLFFAILALMLYSVPIIIYY